MFQYTHPLMKFMEALFDYVVLGLLWLVTSLPLVTMGLSCCALFRAGFLRVHQPGCGVIRTYLRCLRDNFRQGMLFSLPLGLFTAGLALTAIQAFFTGGPLSGPAVRILCVVSSLCLFLVYTYGMASLAMFENPPVETLRNTVILALSHPVRTLLCYTVTGLGIYICILFLPLILVVLPTVCAAQAGILWGVFRPYLPDPYTGEGGNP